MLVWLAGVSCALTSKASGAPQCLAGAGLPHTGSVTGLGPSLGKWAPGHTLLPGNGGNCSQGRAEEPLGLNGTGRLVPLPALQRGSAAPRSLLRRRQG